MGLRTDEGLRLDVVIFGGGASGLWLLDELHRRGFGVVLLEATELGSGQTVASQGIIHGGLKYTLRGLLSSSAQAIRDMPLLWRRCLAGEREPDLSRVRRRAEYCHLWRTQSIKSRVGLVGARAGLNITPRSIDMQERPDVLRACPGHVSRLDEQVIDPGSLLSVLADRHQPRLLRIDMRNGLEFRCGTERGSVERILLINPSTGDSLDLLPRTVVLCAGAGNSGLRNLLNLPDNLMQRRPLHMVMLRGDLPVINGHCVDGRATRATITTALDFAERTVWQVGGAIAERGVRLDPNELAAYARDELEAVLPGVDLSNASWATYRVDRAEAGTGGSRPDDVFVRREGDVITAWPTKLALVPKLVDRVVDTIIRRDRPCAAEWLSEDERVRAFPRPQVAWGPWERVEQWRHLP